MIGTDLWDHFYFDSVFAYCANVMYKFKQIVVAIFKTSLEVHPEHKMLLRIKIHKWNEFQEQFSLSLALGKASIPSNSFT